MKESRRRILQLIYDYDQEEGGPLSIPSDGSGTPFEKLELRNDIPYLVLHGYIEELPSPLGSYWLALTEKGENYVEADFHAPSKTSGSVSNVFNIENATNSVIGTQASVTLNVGDTLQEIKDQINSSDSNDKQELRELIDLLEKTMTSEVSIKKGAFSKFSSAIQKNSWIANPIASALLKWITSQIS